MLQKLAGEYVRRLKDVWEKVMNLPDSPRKIAQGVALGAALDFLPMPFISIPISFLIAKLIRVNAAAAVLAVIFLKWAVPFFFAFNYFIGRILMGEAAPPPYAADSFCLTSPAAWIDWITHLGYPFLIGAAVNSAVAGVVTYFAVMALLDCRRKKKEQLAAMLSRK